MSKTTPGLAYLTASRAVSLKHPNMCRISAAGRRRADSTTGATTERRSIPSHSDGPRVRGAADGLGSSLT